MGWAASESRGQEIHAAAMLEILSSSELEKFPLDYHKELALNFDALQSICLSWCDRKTM